MQPSQPGRIRARIVDLSCAGSTARSARWVNATKSARPNPSPYRRLVLRWFDARSARWVNARINPSQPKPARPPARPFDPPFPSSVRLSVFYQPCAQENKRPRLLSVRLVGKGAGRCFGSHRRPTSASDRAGPCSAGARWLYRLHNSPSREPAGQRSARPFDEPKPPARERVLESPGNRTAAAAAAGPGRRARPQAEARRRRRRRPVCPGQGPRRGRGLEGARRPRAVRDPPHVPCRPSALTTTRGVAVPLLDSCCCLQGSVGSALCAPRAPCP